MLKRYENIINKFREHFLCDPIYILKAPGRVNLIGEHVDYCGGNVFPCAINMNIIMAASPRSDSKFKVYSCNFNEEAEFSTTNIPFDFKNKWSNYIRGVLDQLEYRKIKNIKGMNILFDGNIPVGGGLSSSAALEVATIFLMNLTNNLSLKAEEMALLAQAAEGEFVGVKCGIMDQFVSLLAKKDSALMINCKTLEYEHVSLNLKDASIVITNTKVKRGLATSAYNERRRETEEGLGLLKKHCKDASFLCDIKPSEFEQFKDILPEIIRRRCEHVIYENDRVLKARGALKKDNIIIFGKLMNESHESLKTLYEVSCPELNLLVTKAQEIEGVIGSRLTGAGFGGCTVSIVNNSSLSLFKESLTSSYMKEFNMEPEFYISTPEGGACLLDKNQL